MSKWFDRGKNDHEAGGFGSGRRRRRDPSPPLPPSSSVALSTAVVGAPDLPSGAPMSQLLASQVPGPMVARRAAGPVAPKPRPSPRAAQSGANAAQPERCAATTGASGQARHATSIEVK